MTLLQAGILMTVSLVEITFYIGALFPDPAQMASISLRIIDAAHHLYFIVGAPALFLPLGIVLIRSRILPSLLGYLALALAAAFAILGACFLLYLTLLPAVTGSAGVQALWWLAASVKLMARSGKLAGCEGARAWNP